MDNPTTGGLTTVREGIKTAGDGMIYLDFPQPYPVAGVTFTNPTEIKIDWGTHKKNVIAIIPARGNSKSIPRKNMVSFRGKPLVQWSVEAALNAKSITKTVLTTEDDEIARLASTWGIEKVINRPGYLSQDHVQVEEAVLQTLRVLEYERREIIDVLVILQPTSPLRTASDIDAAVELFYSGHGEPVISGCVDSRYHWILATNDDRHVHSLCHNPFANGRLGRQWNKPSEVRVENGGIYVIDAQRFSLRRTFWYEEPPLFYEMSPENMVELDDMEDWKQLE